MNKILELIKNAKNIALFGHRNPDVDALGSLFAMQKAMLQLGKNCTVFLTEKPSAKYDFLKFDSIKYEPENGFDLMISVDTSSPRLLGDFEKWFTSHKNSISIDHHISREDFSCISYVDYKKSSNCEILFELLKALEITITQEVASALYAGILDDTGGFMFSSTTKNTLNVAGELIQKGADFVHIGEVLFSSIPLNELKMLGAFISKIEIFGNIGIGVVTTLSKKKYGIENYDTNRFANTILSIDGIDIALLIKQKDNNNFGVSLRSSQKYNVSKLAKIFGGGGHFSAAGFSILGNLKTVKKMLKSSALDFALNYKEK